MSFPDCMIEYCGACGKFWVQSGTDETDVSSATEHIRESEREAEDSGCSGCQADATVCSLDMIGRAQLASGSTGTIKAYIGAWGEREEGRYSGVAEGGWRSSVRPLKAVAVVLVTIGTIAGQPHMFLEPQFKPLMHELRQLYPFVRMQLHYPTESDRPTHFC